MSNKTILCNLTLVRQANTTIKNQCIKAGQTKFNQHGRITTNRRTNVVRNIVVVTCKPLLNLLMTVTAAFCHRTQRGVAATLGVVSTGY